MTNAMPTDNASRERTATSAPTRYGSFAHKPWLLALVLVIVTVVAYQPTWHAGFIWDDDYYVMNNPVLRSLGGLESIWFKPGATVQYYPLVFSSFWGEYHLWALRPLGYHLVNVLLHGMNAMLLWQVLRRLEVPGAWWAAAIFALHPMCVESVAWITERKNVLSGLFYLLAVLAFLRFRPLTNREAAVERHWRFYPLVLVLFLCALLSKTVTCSLPAVICLLLWWKTGRIDKRDVLALVPLFVLGIASGFMTTWMEKHRVGASGEEWALSFVQRCLVAGRALWFYAGKLFWPHNLTFIYPRWVIDASVAWQYLFPLAALVVLIALWLLRSRIGRGPLVAVLCFAGTLVPALGFFDVFPFRYSFVADHFQYLACIGLITLLVSMVTTICQRAGQHGNQLGALVAGIVLLTLGASTWAQAHVYHDIETLWRDTLAKDPQCWIAHNNLGVILVRRGRVKEAMGHYEEVLRANPNFAEAHYDLGDALIRLGKPQDAIVNFERALRIRPDWVPAQNNLAWVLATLPQAEGGDPVRAVSLAQRACELTGNRSPGYLDTLAVAYAASGRFDEAVATAQKAIDFARSAGQAALVKEIKARLELYRNGRAYRQPVGVTSPRNP